MNKKLTVIFTCYNRKDKSVAAMKSIVCGNPNIDFEFIVVDDSSKDGTAEAIKELNYNVEVIQGSGSLFWCGGMRVGIDRYFEIDDGTDCLLINDDVEFFDGAIEKMVAQRSNDQIIVGATCDKNGNFTYGLRIEKNKHSIELDGIRPNNENLVGDTMNANCVLIPYTAFREAGNMDAHYTHSLGDYDLGYRLKKLGFNLVSSTEYIGICGVNPFEGTWRDSKLPRLERLRKKETPKGTPSGEWFYFLKKNYGLYKAIKYSVTPFVKILIGQ